MRATINGVEVYIRLDDRSFSYRGNVGHMMGLSSINVNGEEWVIVSVKNSPYSKGVVNVKCQPA